MNTVNNNTTTHLTIAVIDDHDLIRDKVSEMLIDLGFDVVLKACHGEDLLEQLSISAITPDICLLDISMPVMNGFITAQNLRRSYPQIKILAFSMDNDEPTVKKIIQCGAHGFAVKNIHPLELKNKLLEISQ